MEGYRKYMIDRFQEHLQRNFKEHCERHGIVPNENQLLTFLIDQNLISTTNIQKYTVVQEFEKIYPARSHQKTQAVNALANLFSISERTVWSILKHIKRIHKK